MKRAPWGVLVCAFGLGSTPVCASSAELWSPTSWPALVLRPMPLAARAVTLDLEAIVLAAPGDLLDLDLDMGQAPFTTVVEAVTRRSPTSLSVRGRFPDDPDGFLLLALEGEAVAGLIQVPAALLARPGGSRYVLHYVGDGVHELSPVEGLEIPDCATPDGPGTPSGAGAPNGNVPPDGSGGDPFSPDATPFPGSAAFGSCAAPVPRGDVMIYYTPAARAEAGSTNAMNAECQLAVDTANLTYDDSGIANRLTLIFRGEIPYIESGDSETDRNRLKDTSDGFLDAVHADRNVYGGDFVSLFIKQADSDACGIAYCTPSGPSEGFCIVARGCASSNFSFAHEIGHLQGCAHNLEDAGFGCVEYCFSYGHRFFGNSGTGWRTVMSYDTDPGSFARIGRWSNPNVVFDGQPCGVWDGDCDDDSAFNAATVVGTALDRESWRNPRFEVWVEQGSPGSPRGTYQQPFSTVVAGISAVFAGGPSPAQPVLRVKSAGYPEVMTMSKPMRVEACGGSVTIGR